MDDYPLPNSNPEKLSNAFRILSIISPDEAKKSSSIQVSFGRYQYLATKNQGKANLDKARAHLKKAISLDPRNLDAYRFMAALEIFAGSEQATRKFIKYVERLSPGTSIAISLNAQLALKEGKLEEAKKLAKSSLSKPADELVIRESLLTLAEIAETEKQHKEALLLYLKLNKRYPKDSGYFFRVMRSLLRLEQYDQVIKREALIRQFPYVKELKLYLSAALYLKGKGLYQKGGTSQAKPFFDRAIEANDEDWRGYYGLGIYQFNEAIDQGSKKLMLDSQENLARAAELGPNIGNISQALKKVTEIIDSGTTLTPSQKVDVFEEF